MTKKTGTAVAKTGSTEIVIPDYGDDAGAGFEGTTGSDLTIPFINVLQALSPEVTKKTVEGAEPGMIFNTVTRELVDGEEGLVFQPVLKRSVFVEWVPRTKGGGMIAQHDPESDIVREALEKVGGRAMGPLPLGTIDKEGKGDTELVETVYVNGLILDATGLEYEGFGLLSFTSTKMKVWRNWHTAMFTIKGAKKPPLFAHRAHIKTFMDTNRKNQEYYNFMVSPLKSTWAESLLNPAVEAELVLMETAKKFQEMIKSGAAKADYKNQEGSEDATGGDSTLPF